MLDIIINTAVWFAAISTGLMAGVYFTFSAFVMKSFGQLDEERATTAMNMINEVILRSWFMPLFFGSTLVSIAIAVFSGQHPESFLLILASSLYVIGMFLVTFFFNVPLNKRLATKVNPGELIETWEHYLKYWTRWNHIRTVSSLLALFLYLYVLWFH